MFFLDCSNFEALNVVICFTVSIYMIYIVAEVEDNLDVAVLNIETAVEELQQAEENVVSCLGYYYIKIKPT
jgi:hypothetical protein